MPEAVFIAGRGCMDTGRFCHLNNSTGTISRGFDKACVVVREAALGEKGAQGEM
jgi:hypothetical protein